MNPNLDVYVLATGAGCAGMLVGWIIANCIPLASGRPPADSRRQQALRGRVMRIDVAAARVRKRRSAPAYLAFRQGLAQSSPVSRARLLRERVCHFFHRAGNNLYIRA
jgi:hypothetical protein